MYRHSPQPVDDVILALQLPELRMQLHEHILRRLFREKAIAQNAQGNAEHHRLVLQHQRAKGMLRSFQVCILPSTWYTLAAAAPDAEFSSHTPVGYPLAGTEGLIAQSHLPNLLSSSVFFVASVLK
jgi:hypothetical protein